MKIKIGRLNIPVIAMVDTNSDPTDIDFPIPANDDAFKSIEIITREVGKVIEQALMERKKDKEEAKRKEEEEAKRKVDEQPKEEVSEKA
jgi:small subunit ribosomal protein S2